MPIEFKGGDVSTSSNLLNIRLVLAKESLGMVSSFSESTISLELLHKSSGNLVLSMEISPMPLKFMLPKNVSSILPFPNMLLAGVDTDNVIFISVLFFTAFWGLISSEYPWEELIIKAAKTKRKALIFWLIIYIYFNNYFTFGRVLFDQQV